MSRPNDGPFGSMQMEEIVLEEQAGDNYYDSGALIEDDMLDMASVFRKGVPRLTDLPPFGEDNWGSSAGMTFVAPELCPTQNFWLNGFNPTSSDSYPTQDFAAIEKDMLESTFPSLNDSGFTDGSATDQKAQQLDVSSINDMARPQAPGRPQSQRLARTSEIGNNFHRKSAQEAKLIDGEVVLRLLFKYIPCPTMMDIENIANDTGYSFDFVINSYCQYRKSSEKGHVSFDQSKQGSQEHYDKKAEFTTDSAYATQSQEPVMSGALPANRGLRLDENPLQEPRPSVGRHAQTKPHRCTLCNQAFKRRADLKRHMGIHAPGSFPCPYVGCGKFFSRQDKLNEHYKKSHEESASQNRIRKSKRDDSDHDPNSGGPPASKDHFPSNGSSQGSQNSASSTSSALSNHNAAFGGGCFTCARDALDMVPLEVLHSSPKYQRELSSWRVIRKLGHGGFGSVYSVSIHGGDNGQDDKMVASKIIKIPQDRRREAIRRIWNEISILQLLDHSHIVKLAGAHALADRVFVNTFPVADCNLTKFLSKHNLPISPLDKVTMMEQLGEVASGLSYIHNYRSNIVHFACHGDLKPDNILVTLDAESGSLSKLLICDFGSAVISKSTLEINHGNRAITPKYAAPELFGGEMGPKSDIWSFGCIIAELYTCLLDLKLQYPDVFGSRNMISGKEWTYSENRAALVDYLEALSRIHDLQKRSPLRDSHVDLVIEMLQLNPQERPSASDVMKRLRAAADVNTKDLGGDQSKKIESNLGQQGLMHVNTIRKNPRLGKHNWPYFRFRCLAPTQAYDHTFHLRPTTTEVDSSFPDSSAIQSPTLDVKKRLTSLIDIPSLDDSSDSDSDLASLAAEILAKARDIRRTLNSPILIGKNIQRRVYEPRIRTRMAATDGGARRQRKGTSMGVSMNI